MPELSIVVPTFNEAQNVRTLIARLHGVLGSADWEVVFVDDNSPDGTAELVASLAQTDRHVRCIRRVGRRGLSSAVIEGILSTSAPFVAVMDADLQHDEAILPRMLEVLRSADTDMVVASRYMAGGSIGNFSQTRARISRAGTQLAHLVAKTALSDPMSGFFAIRRGVFGALAPRLSAQGFKILLDILASSQAPLRVKEIPYIFGHRMAGESKLDSVALWDYAMLLADKIIGKFIPLRFMLFALVGGLGFCVHFATLLVLFRMGHLPFQAAQGWAVLLAMTSNFFLNNSLTYRDQRLKGPKLYWGLLSFYGVCSMGAVANLGVSSFVFGHGNPWWLAGAAGAMIGAVWNFAASSSLTWRKTS